MVKNRIAELDILRGMAILGVLVIHSGFVGRFGKETMAVQAILARLFDWAVLAFFFGSGFLHDQFASFAITLKKRFVSLLAPFFLYNLIYNVCFAVTGILPWVHRGYFTWTSDSLVAGLFRSPAFQLYFLPYLFVISTGICLVDKLAYPHGGRTYLILFGLVLVFYIWRGYPEVSHGPEFAKLPLYLAAFVTGQLSRPYLEQPFAKTWMVVTALGGVLCVLMLSRLPFISLTVPPLLVGLARTIPKIAHSKLLLCTGLMSGTIYLWHTPVMLPAITSLLAYCGFTSLFNFFGSIGLTLVICILLRLGLDAFFLQVMKTQTPKYITL